MLTHFIQLISVVSENLFCASVSTPHQPPGLLERNSIFKTNQIYIKNKQEGRKCFINDAFNLFNLWLYGLGQMDNPVPDFIYSVAWGI